jgi:DNA-binding NarL/FixJ family response regulator
MRNHKKIRVVICNQYTLFREGIKAMFGPESPIAVVGEADTARKMLRVVQRLHPDVVLMDTTMPDSSGSKATRMVKASNPNVKVLIVSLYDDEPLISSCLTAGAVGFIRHTQRSEQLKHAILLARGKGVRAA